MYPTTLKAAVRCLSQHRPTEPFARRAVSVFNKKRGESPLLKANFERSKTLDKAADFREYLLRTRYLTELKEESRG